jgi:hypothetical protein
MGNDQRGVVVSASGADATGNAARIECGVNTMNTNSQDRLCVSQPPIPPRRGPVKYLPLLGFAAAVLFGPQLLEGSADSCSALASRLVVNHASELTSNAGGQALVMGVAKVIGGPLVAARVQQVNGGLPPFIGCPVSYWVEFIKPGALAVKS